MMDAADDTQREQSEQPEDNPAGPARELTLHLLRMLETRADAAGIAIQSEIDSFGRRLQLRVVAGAAIFFAVWAGIVLLAIVLPPHLRVPVLSGVVAAFVIGAIVAMLAANRTVASRDVGSMAWFLDSLKRDIDVFSRALEKTHAPAPPASPPTEQGSPNELAA
jgi:uncharacterized membrane protein YqjE